MQRRDGGSRDAVGRMKRVVALAIIAMTLAACGSTSHGGKTPATSSTPAQREPTSTAVASPLAGGASPDIHKIKHVVIIMQENRSFDTYFGTFPGADGIPMKDGVPTVCVNNPSTGQCVKPYHDANDKNVGGPARRRRRDGRHRRRQDGRLHRPGGAWPEGLQGPERPRAAPAAIATDVMGYHDAREIPNYWAYAQNFVLQDRMFEPNASWSLPSHLFMVSEWSGDLSDEGRPDELHSALDQPDIPPDFRLNRSGKRSSARTTPGRT